MDLTIEIVKDTIIPNIMAKEAPKRAIDSRELPSLKMSTQHIAAKMKNGD